MSWFERNLLALCLLAPVPAAFLRKFVPGQPASVRVAGVGLVFIAIVWGLTQTRRAPTWLRVPVLVWGLFCLAYAIPAFFVHPALGVAAIALYIVPLGMVNTAYVAYRGPESLERLAKAFGWLAVVLFPLGVLVPIFGNEALPWWLGPTQEALAVGLDYSKRQFPAPSLLFATPSELAYNMLPAAYLALAVIAERHKRGAPTRKYWIFAVAATVLIYLCSRRAVFLAVLPGYLLVFTTRVRRVALRRVIPLLLILFAVFAFDRFGQVTGTEVQRRSQIYTRFDVAERLTNVLGEVTLTWMETAPIGNFLGYSGPLGQAFGVELEHSMVEVGAASIVADQGVGGLFLFLLVTGLGLVRLFVRNRRLRSGAATQLLCFAWVAWLIYLGKSLRVLTSATPTHFLFWAALGLCAALLREEAQRQKALAAQAAESTDESTDETGATDPPPGRQSRPLLGPRT